MSVGSQSQENNFELGMELQCYRCLYYINTKMQQNVVRSFVRQSVIKAACC